MPAISRDAGQYIASGEGTTVLHTNKGYVLGIIATTDQTSAEEVILYDNVAASGSVLLGLFVTAPNPVVIMLPDTHRLLFEIGLTVVPGNCNVHVITIA